MNQRDKELLQQAIDLGYEGLAQADCGPIGAIIAKDGKVVAAVHNEAKKRYDPTAHAEVLAIRQACEQLAQMELTGYTLYCSAEPCPMCLGAIYWSKIERIVYAVEKEKTKEYPQFEDKEMMEEMNKERDAREVIYNQTLRTAGVQLLEKYKQQQNESGTNK